jgi:pimeloyl-ACP methyl ester carboxylesterase
MNSSRFYYPVLLFVLFLSVFANAEDEDWITQNLSVETDNFVGTVSWVTQSATAFPRATLIGIHGTPGSWTAWKPLMENPSVAREFDVLAFDRPGWGNSQNSEESVFPTLNAQADILAATIEKIDIQTPIILVAHSWGGPVALALAARYPEVADGMVLIASPADPRVSEPRWYHRLAKTQPVKFLIGNSMRRSNIEMLTLDDELAALAKDLSSITMPVAVLQGKKDWLVKPQNAFYLQRELENADVLLDYDLETNHFIPFNDTPRVVNALNWASQSIETQLIVCQTDQYC